MSVYTDRLFLLRVSNRLDKFVQKKQDLYNFRCPFCGDSKKDKNLARGYIYRKSDDYLYKCHNCTVTKNFYQFLEQVEPTLIKEYSLERYKQNNVGRTFEEKEEPDYSDLTKKPKFKKNLGIPSIDDLPDDHIAKKYCISRKIPEEMFHSLYYAEDFKNFALTIDPNKKSLVEADKRLVIPFYGKDKTLLGVQGRTLTDSKLRYITVKANDDRKFFGIDRINENEMIYVVEGPIDSLFLNNAIATADANLISASDIFDKTNITLIFDNEPRNHEIIKLMSKAIDDHYNIVIWPEMIDAKDINDMILDGFTKEELLDIIDKNTFVNLRAKMEFIQWKKV